jgi:acyl-CoA dehydrogenase
MALLLNEEQSMLRDSARTFLAGNAPVSHLRALRDQRDATGFSRPLWERFAEMGFCGIAVPEAYGGLGLGSVEAGVLMEEIGRTLVPSPFLSTGVLTATALVRGGSDAQRERYLPQLAAGRLVGALAVDEAARHRPDRIATTATSTPDGFVLRGAKTFVVDGHVADLIVVAARVEPAATDAAVALLLVPGDAPGLERERTVMVDAHNAARLTLRDVRVGRDALLTGAEAGENLLETVLDAGRAVVAAELLGAADEAFARTLAYLKERKQFGKTIGEFQALQHRAAHLYGELEITRAAVLAALQAMQTDPGAAAAAVSIAKARAGATATLAVQEAVQMHGGVGMTDALEIGFFMKRVRVANELLGDASFHADRLARLRKY